MSTEDDRFIAKIKAGYTPDEMMPADVRRFDEALNNRLNHGHRGSRPLIWTFAVAVVVLGFFSFTSLDVEESPEAEVPSSGIAAVSEQGSEAEDWPNANDISALSLEGYEAEALEEVLQDEWLPDDYQALAMVIDFNQE